MRCLFGLTMDDLDPNGDPPVMTYAAFIYILQKVAAGDESFRTSFEADPEGTMSAASYELDISGYTYADPIRLPSAIEAQAILQGYLTDYDGDQQAGMGGVQQLGDPVESRINNSSS